MIKAVDRSSRINLDALVRMFAVVPIMQRKTAHVAFACTSRHDQPLEQVRT